METILCVGEVSSHTAMLVNPLLASGGKLSVVSRKCLPRGKATQEGLFKIPTVVWEKKVDQGLAACSEKSHLEGSTDGRWDR